jgi:excisionase family DNA binding protein
MSQETQVITVNELCKYLRVHRSTLYSWLKKGKLPGVRIGSDWRFNVEAIARWRMQQAVPLDMAENADTVHEPRI